MSARPRTERFHGLPQGAAELGQFVIHTLRSGGEDSPRHQAVSLQSTQREREHPLGDTADHPPDLIEALRAIAEQDDDEHGPLISYVREYGAEVATVFASGIEEMDGHVDVDVLWYQICAFLRTISSVPILDQVVFIYRVGERTYGNASSMHWTLGTRSAPVITILFSFANSRN